MPTLLGHHPLPLLLLAPVSFIVSQILDIRRPCDIPDEGLLCDLLWADPEAGIPGWGYNARGVSFIFGHDVISEFLIVRTTKERNAFSLCAIVAARIVTCYVQPMPTPPPAPPTHLNSAVLLVLCPELFVG